MLACAGCGPAGECLLCCCWYACTQVNGLINFSGKPVIKHLAHELLAMEAMHQLIMQEECVDDC